MLETIMLNPKIAEDNIVCYKVVTQLPDVEEQQRVKSTVMSYEYKVGVLNANVDVRVDNVVYTDVDRSRFVIVKEGYHSYTNISDIGAVTTGQQIRECIVPKGSRYFLDVYNKQMVSSNIIITEKIIK